MIPVQSTKLVSINLIILLLAGCGNFLKPHKINVQQGNIITRGMLNQLELGQTKKQVKYILGTPLIADTFTPDKWYYRYNLRLGTGAELTHTLKLSFADNKLIDIFSDPPINTYSDKSDEPAQQLLRDESEKLEKSLPTEIEDSLNDAGI